MGCVVDGYHLNLECVCLKCENFKQRSKLIPHSCKAFPKRNGIPPKVWNEKNADCECFEEKHSD